MRKIQKLLALTLSAVVLVNCLAGCGEKENSGKGGSESTSEIEIAVWNSGLGIEWLKNMISGFEDKHPEYHVRYTATASAAATLSAYGLEDADSVDLYFAPMASMDFTCMEPLDDILDTTVEGEGITIGEKFHDYYLEEEKAADGHVYTLTYGGGVFSLIYNKELFDKAGVTQLPRTTNELIAVCDALYGKGITPLCHFAQGGYYEFLLNLYVAQYNGYDYFANNLYANRDENGNSPSKEAFLAKDGRYQVLKVFEKIITPEYTLLGSNTKSHTEIQTEFINGKAAMMLNGSWLKNEMESTGGIDKMSVMRVPVISSITDRLSTIKTDSNLRKVITAVDQVADGEKQLSDFASGDNYDIDGITVSPEDWAIVYEARNTVTSNYAGSDAFIPSYSNAKEGAKEFLKYMYSDEGYQIFVDTLNIPLPMTLSTGKGADYSSFTEFEQFQFKILEAAERAAEPFNANQSRLFTAGGVDIMANVSYADKFSSQNSRDRMTADEVWGQIVSAIENTYESTWLKNIK